MIISIPLIYQNIFISSDLYSNKFEILNKTIGHNDVKLNAVPFNNVRNESGKHIFPAAIPKSDEDDEFRLSSTCANIKQFLNHAWNDVYWLAHLVVWMGFFGVLLSLHADLNLQVLGARMRIACCSLIYRKVKI